MRYKKSSDAQVNEEAITSWGQAKRPVISFASEDDWIDYRLENDPRFLARIVAARASYRAGLGVKLEDVDLDDPAAVEF